MKATGYTVYAYRSTCVLFAALQLLCQPVGSIKRGFGSIDTETVVLAGNQLYGAVPVSLVVPLSVCVRHDTVMCAVNHKHRPVVIKGRFINRQIHRRLDILTS